MLKVVKIDNVQYFAIFSKKHLYDNFLLEWDSISK